MDYGALSTLNGYMNHFFAQTLCITNTIRHISNGWLGMPYWNIWFELRDGAYKMELASLDTSVPGQWDATFYIKYYPARYEQHFYELSEYEQACRNSTMFFGTPSFAGCECGSSNENSHTVEHRLKEMGVPSLAFLDSIPQDFFLAGEIKMLYSKSEGSKLTMKAPERWRVLLKRNVCLEKASNMTNCVENEWVDRNFPGYELTLFLYRQIESHWGPFHNYQKKQETKLQEGGFDFVYDGQILQKRLSSDIAVKTIYAIFS